MTLDTASYDITLPWARSDRLGQEIGAQLAGAQLSLLPAPVGNLGMVTREQDLGDRVALEHRRPGVLGIFQQLLREGLVQRRVLGPQHARKQPRHGVDHRKRRQLAAAQDVVPDRKLAVGQMLGNPLVHALVAPTDQEEVRFSGQVGGDRLREPLALGAEQDHRPLTASSTNRLENRLRFQHHAGSASVWHVIDLAVAVAGGVTQVVDYEVDQARRQRTAGDTVLQRSRKQSREDGEDFEGQRASTSSGRSTRICRAALSTERTIALTIGTRTSPWTPLTRSTSLAG